MTIDDSDQPKVFNTLKQALKAVKGYTTDKTVYKCNDDEIIEFINE